MTRTGTPQVETHQGEVTKYVLVVVFMQFRASDHKLSFISVGGLLTQASPQIHSINTKAV